MIKPTLALETSYWKKGFINVCGIDEVGRGSWAGPLVVAGVILPQNFKQPDNLRDSKLVPANQRENLSELIIKTAKAYSIVEIKSQVIDKIGLTKATNVAFRKVLNTINPKADFTLIDAFYIKHISKKRQQAIKNGDKICASIAAASVIAKVYRDNLMKNLHKHYPKYGFNNHVGYGTREHQQAIKIYGLSKIHRKSYNLDFLFA
ncbi:ribonuclease HII [Candidatus Curtissbacteria bacterium]|nr:ribonuclease HII [Candidatus Curtissbacteria bacterium]